MIRMRMSRSQWVGSAMTLAWLALPGGSAQALEPTQVFEKVSPSVWVVRTFDAEDRPVGQGSAVVIGPGRLVTNCHVLAKSKMVMVRRTNVMYEAKLEHADAPRDLCLLTVANFTAPAVAVRSVKELKVGERAYAIGNPQGFEVTLSEGLISGLRGELPGLPVDQGGSEVIQTTAPISPGSSGGGLFDAEGRLVGITSLIRRDAQNINIALPADWLAEVPDRARTALARHASGAADTEAASAAPPGYPAAGTTWVYEYIERFFSRQKVNLTVHVVRVHDAIVEETVTTSAGGGAAARRLVNARDAQFLEHALGSSGALVEFAPYLLAGSKGQAPTDVPSAAGYPLGGGGLPGWVVSTQVHDWEQVRVPAGTFRALRIEAVGRRSANFSARSTVTGRFRMSVWYAPEVKRFVRLEHRVWSADAFTPTQIGEEVIELLSYQPSSPGSQ